jgi:hypothetical protein
MKKTQKEKTIDVLAAFPNFEKMFGLFPTRLMDYITQADVEATKQYDIHPDVLLICAANGIKVHLTNQVLFTPKSLGSKNMIGYDRNGEPIGQFTPDETLAVSKIIVSLHLMDMEKMTIDLLNVIGDFKASNKKFKKILE